MELNYNCTGESRKRLVTAISEITGVPAKYLGAPSFAYQVDYFTIDRNGGVTFDDRADSEEIENLIETLDSQGFTAEPQEVEAYDHFICALCEMARNQKRITAKERDTGNDKYAFRCFLLRLGFIGPEYKQERKILLRNLTGSSAFKAVPQKEVADDAAPE